MGSFDNLSALAWGITVFGIVIGLGSLVLSKFQDQMTANTTAYNNTADVTTGIGTLASMTSVIALSAVALVIIGLFMTLRGRQ